MHYLIYYKDPREQCVQLILKTALSRDIHLGFQVISSASTPHFVFKNSDSMTIAFTGSIII